MHEIVLKRYFLEMFCVMREAGYEGSMQDSDFNLVLLALGRRYKIIVLSRLV